MVLWIIDEADVVKTFDSPGYAAEEKTRGASSSGGLATKGLWKMSLYRKKGG